MVLPLWHRSLQILREMAPSIIYNFIGLGIDQQRKIRLNALFSFLEMPLKRVILALGFFCPLSDELVSLCFVLDFRKELIYEHFSEVDIEPVVLSSPIEKRYIVPPIRPGNPIDGVDDIVFPI